MNKCPEMHPTEKSPSLAFHKDTHKDKPGKFRLTGNSELSSSGFARNGRSPDSVKMIPPHSGQNLNRILTEIHDSSASSQVNFENSRRESKKLTYDCGIETSKNKAFNLKQ